MLRSSISLIALIASAASTAACVYEDDPPRRLRGDPDDSAVSAPPAAAPAASPGNGAAPTPANPGAPISTSPMLVEVDSDQTMNAVGGEGVGVFVEYQKGGHWHVWWTCDTKATSQTCDFSISVSSATGALANLDPTELAGGLYSSPTPARLDARSTTSNEVRGVRFDTAAGAVITIEAALGDLKDGSVLFFVQDGKVNGGFTGMLTNPLRFQGSVP